MNIDPNTIALIGASAWAGEKVVAGGVSFLGKLLGPVTNELGELFADNVRNYRAQNAQNILKKSQEICETKKINIKPIAPKILLPVLENASLEEDGDMQNVWAAMIANLADTSKNLNNNIFPYLLNQVSKSEYIFLSEQITEIIRLEEAAKALPSGTDNMPRWYGLGASARRTLEEKVKEAALTNRDKGSIHYRFDIAFKEYTTKVSKLSANHLVHQKYLLADISEYLETVDNNKISNIELQNLIRLGCITINTFSIIESGSESVTDATYGGHNSKSIEFITDVNTYRIPIVTDLGRKFIEVCTI